MHLAIREARNGIGRTAPNPPVGAVIVKNGVLLGKGWHRAAGRPHAEREALAAAVAQHGAAAVQGATAYVTLEPCSTTGRTPPCTEGLIEAGIRRVVYAVADRNPAHVGRADAILRAAGIEVHSGVEKKTALELLRPFFKVQETGLPWVIWKTAMSLDGRLTRPPGEGQWLSGMESRAEVQRIRSEVDGILTSGETVRRDLPQLTIRDENLLEGRTQPWRVVMTRSPETLPVDAPLFTDAWKERTLLRSGMEPDEVLRKLVREQGVVSILLESGGVLAARCFELGLVDEVVVFLTPRLCGGPVTALAGDGVECRLVPESVSYRQFGDDVCLRGRVMRS